MNIKLRNEMNKEIFKIDKLELYGEKRVMNYDELYWNWYFTKDRFKSKIFLNNKNNYRDKKK